VLIDLFQPKKNRLPSYNTVYRALLHLDYKDYYVCLSKFFNVQKNTGETVGLDGKVLKRLYYTGTICLKTWHKPNDYTLLIYTQLNKFLE
jgi:hypothetical protein